MRTNFIEELTVLARTNPNIFLIVGDLGFSVVEKFADEFSDRFINAGIAEQNMTGMAAGLASEGYHVFTYSIANFPTFRCAEQIRNDVVYHNLPVTVVAVGSGMSYGSLGYSHHAVQDYALMRSFPGLLIASPCDPIETRACLNYLSKNPQPSYLRLGKNGEKNQHVGQISEIIEPGKTLHIRGDHHATKLILVTGTAMEIANDPEAISMPGDWCIKSLPLWSSQYADVIVKEIMNYQRIVIVEEHLTSGGFGSFIRECVGNQTSLQSRIYTIGLDKSACEHVASQNKLREIGGLSCKQITDAILSIC
jgi:transketolase